MRVPRPPAAVLARLLVLVGMGVASAGVWLAVGLAGGLVVSGALLALFGLVFVDVDPRREGRSS